MAALHNETLDVDSEYSCDNFSYANWRKHVGDTIALWQEHWRSKNQGELVGETLSWPVADGKATYMVISQKPLILAHMYIGDGYQVPAPMIKGVDIEYVKEVLGRQQTIAELKNKKQ